MEQKERILPVIKAIDNIPAVTILTLDDKQLVELAKSLFDNLPDDDKDAILLKYVYKLKDSINMFAVLEGELEIFQSLHTHKFVNLKCECGEKESTYKPKKPTETKGGCSLTAAQSVFYMLSALGLVCVLRKEKFV